MLRIPGERVSGADEHQAGPGLGDPHLQEAGGRRGKQVRWASLHLSSGRDAHKHLLCRNQAPTCSWTAVWFSDTLPSPPDSATLLPACHQHSHCQGWKWLSPRTQPLGNGSPSVLWFRGTGAGGSSRHSPVTGGIPSTAKTGRQPVAQWFPVPAWHLTPAFPQGCHGSGRSLTSSSLSREGDVPLSSMGGYL